MATDAQKAARILGRIGGLKGGPARIAALTPKQRKDLARRAAEARWARAGKLKRR